MSGLRDLAFAATVVRKRPFNVLVQVTNRCNMTCGFCDFWPNGARPEDELTAADYVRLSDGLARIGAMLVSVEGGEPTVRPDLAEIVAALARHHLTALFTNGWRMTPALARSLWDAGLTHCSVSIDYADAAQHDAARGVVGAADKAWQAVATLRDSAPRGGRQVHVMTIIMHDNVDDIPRLAERAARMGVGQQLTLLSVGGDRRGAGSDKRLPPVGAGAALHAHWRAHREVRFLGDYFARIDDFLAGRPMPTCRAGLAGFNVDHLGNVSPCIERIGETVGNVRDTDVSELVRRMANDRAELDACQRCWTACRGIQQALSSPTLATWRDLSVRTRA